MSFRPALIRLVAALLLLATPVAADPGSLVDGTPIPATDTQARIVGDALAIAPAPEFLTANHYFIITFDTRAKGVDLDDKLRAGFPQQMTVVLQHDFLVLFSGEDSFTVQLHFDGVAKVLTIPYAAVTHFRIPPMGLSLVWPRQNPDGLTALKL